MRTCRVFAQSHILHIQHSYLINFTILVATICVIVNIQMYTVVWEKFTIRYFCVKIVHGKIFLSLGVSDEKIFDNELF